MAFVWVDALPLLFAPPIMVTVGPVESALIMLCTAIIAVPHVNSDIRKFCVGVVGRIMLS